MRGPTTDLPVTAGPATAVAIAAAEPSAVFGLCSSAPGGLSSAEAARRLGDVGPNRIEPRAPVPWWVQLGSNFTHRMAVLLWVAGGLAFAARLPELGVAVWLVNLLNGAFSFWQEHKAERATEALQRLLPTMARVLRDGREAAIDAEALVPGDVLLLEEGERVCADGRLVEAMELRIDQSTLTGESHPAHRTAGASSGRAASPAERRNWVFAGTTVASGRGKAVVTATAMATEFGELASLTQSMTRDLSPLQVELEQVSKIVGAIAVATGLLFFVVAQLLTPMSVTRGLVFALGMIVAFVPEGLLPTVTLALAMGTQRMAGRQALVKRLSAVETLGATTVICTDKTGTLTENQMTVRRIWLADGQVEATGEGYGPVGELHRTDGAPVEPWADLHELLVAASLVNDAALLAPDPEAGRPGWSVRGDPTEGALVALARKGGIDTDGEAARQPRVGEVPFDSARRRMSTLHRSDGGAVLYLKGAPVEVLARCCAIRVHGEDRPLDDATRVQVLAANDGYGREALRVLAVATRRWPATPTGLTPDELEGDLVLLGLVGMMDPPRAAVAEAVATCRRAGIRIVMMTGDYGVTAESIARRIGLVTADAVPIVNGADLDDLDDDALRSLLADELILARTTPAHKLRVVTALQEMGHVVAVTGDGVNDAPALKRADVGVAMGRSGTDVAREAADLVLLDDNFATIVAAVEEGRAVYANIAKFTGYIFTSNTPEAVPFILFGLTGGRLPPALDVMHILAVDLGTDLVPALALGGEPPEPGIMDRPPRRRDDHVIDRALLKRSYLVLGPVQAAIVMAAFYLRYWTAGYGGQWLDLPDEGTLYASATAAALAAVVATQIGNLLAHRTERTSFRQVGLYGNRLLWWGVASELLVIALIVYAPPLQSVIGTAPFPWWMWFALAGVAPTLLVVDEIRKAAVRRAAPTNGATP